jgi:hypothetical protein
MAIFKSQAGTKAALDGLNAVANGGTIRIYNGTVPASADAALAGNTLIVSCTLNSVAWNAATTASPSVATLNTTVAVSGTVNAGGPYTPIFYRVTATNGTTVIHQGAVPTDLDFDVDTGWATGGTVTVTGLTTTMTV